MRRSKKALLAAGLLAGAAAMTGCASKVNATATPTPSASEQATAEPVTAEPATPEPAAEETPEAGSGTEEAPIALRVDGREADVGALREDGTLLLPIIETAQMLGWTADEESTADEAQERSTITLEKEGSRISIDWTTSDNTIRQVTWQKDGLLVPVDAALTSAGGVIYAPAAFFEAAMDAGVDDVADRVEVTAPEPKETPDMPDGENG